MNDLNIDKFFRLKEDEFGAIRANLSQLELVYTIKDRQILDLLAKNEHLQEKINSLEQLCNKLKELNNHLSKQANFPILEF
jgi:hypothetical protein